VNQNLNQKQDVKNIILFLISFLRKEEKNYARMSQAATSAEKELQGHVTRK
jgi:hypothetical protein